jgi:hypothetical protein
MDGLIEEGQHVRARGKENSPRFTPLLMLRTSSIVGREDIIAKVTSKLMAGHHSRILIHGKHECCITAVLLSCLNLDNPLSPFSPLP